MPSQRAQPSHVCKAEKLLRRIAPEDFADRPIYLLSRSAVPRELWLGNAVGFTWGALDYVLRPELESCGLWGGRGFACAISIVAILRRARVTGSSVLGTYISTALHEAAHHLESNPLLIQDSDLPLTLAAGREVLKRQALSAESFVDEDPPWSTHDLRWHRAFAHLRYRAMKAGADQVGIHVNAGSRYGLSSMGHYDRVFAREASKLRRESIRSVLRWPMPEEAQELFDADVAIWHRATRYTEQQNQQRMVTAEDAAR